AGERAARAAEGRVAGTGRRLLRRLPAAGLAVDPLLLVDDLDAARGPGCRLVRIAAPAVSAPLRDVFPGGGAVAGRELHRVQPRPLRPLTPREPLGDTGNGGWRRGRSALASSADSAAAVPVLVSPRDSGPGATGSSSRCRARS